MRHRFVIALGKTELAECFSRQVGQNIAVVVSREDGGVPHRTLVTLQSDVTRDQSNT